MSAIRLRTTPKSDLPLYSHVFSNTDPLGMKLNSLACSRLVTVLYLEIQKGNEAMRKSEIQLGIIGTTECMKRLMRGTK